MPIFVNLCNDPLSKKYHFPSITILRWKEALLIIVTDYSLLIVFILDGISEV